MKPRNGRTTLWRWFVGAVLAVIAGMTPLFIVPIAAAALAIAPSGAGAPPRGRGPR